MRKVKLIAAYTAAILFGAALAAHDSISQQTVTPGGIYDLVRNAIVAQTSLTSQGTLAVTGTSTFTGAVTPTGGIAPAAGSSSSPRLLASGDSPASATTSGNDSAPVSTETYVFEIFVPSNMTLTGVALFNGSIASGNVTVGLANAAGVPIAAAKSASTVVSGVTAYQRVPFTAPYAALGPATYYIQVQYDNATVRYRTHTVGNFGCTKQTAQVYGTLTSFTPPTTFTTNICNLSSLY